MKKTRENLVENRFYE